MASKCKLSKEAFIKLAEAYSKQEKYENELKSSVHSLAEKYKVYMGFIGLSSSSDLIMDVVLDLLGEDFSYYFYDYDESFNKFNKNTTLADGTLKKDQHLEEQAKMLEKLRARGYRAEFGVGFEGCKQIIDEYFKKQD